MVKKWASRLYENIPYAVIFVITILYIILPLVKHAHYQTYAYDLGIYDQTVWLYSRFIYPFVTIEYKFALLNHFSPSLALFAPFYWIWSDARFLLIIQALMIGASAIPFHLLAKKLGLPAYLRTVFIFSYLTFYGYQYSVDYDVHSLVYGATLLPWFIWALEEKRFKLAAIIMAITLGMKESFPVLTFAIGLVYFLRGQRRLGVKIVTASLIYLALVTQAIIPLMQWLSGEHYRFTASAHTSFFDFFTNLFDSSDKLEVWKLSMIWFAFLPLLSPVTFLAALADITFYFIFGNNHPETLTLYKHYRSSLAPLLAWSTLHGLLNLKKYQKYLYPALTLLLLIIFGISQHDYDLPLNRFSNQQFWEQPEYINDINQILKKVPPDAAVAAQNNIVPHLSQRKEIHVVWHYPKNEGYKQFDQAASPCGYEYCYWLNFHEKTEYLVTETHPYQNAVTLLMENDQKLREGLENMEKYGIISKIEQHGTAILWKVDRIKNLRMQVVEGIR